MGSRTPDCYLLSIKEDDMKIIAAGLAVLVAAAFAATDKAPAKAESMISLQPSDLVWSPAPPSLPPGAMVAAVEGDMTKAQFFAARIKLPPGYKVPPHWHPGYERVTVIEGDFQLGSGENADESALKSYPAGAYISMPPKMRHFAMTKEGAIIQIATMGPWDITYVHPSDDPRTKKGS
jgi:quercetin dioxygenase-like cupin family protein